MAAPVLTEIPIIIKKDSIDTLRHIVCALNTTSDKRKYSNKNNISGWVCFGRQQLDVCLESHFVMSFFRLRHHHHHHDTFAVSCYDIPDAHSSTERGMHKQRRASLSVRNEVERLI
jgi:hypothetical protein